MEKTLAYLTAMVIFCISTAYADQIEDNFERQVKPGDLMPYCSVRSLLYKQAAEYKNTGRSPQDFMKEQVDPYPVSYVSSKEVKYIVNFVYFKLPNIIQTPEMLNRQVYSDCINNKPSGAQFPPIQ